MEKRRFTFTCEGQYYGAHDATGAPTIKAYVAKFVLPSQEAALSVICKHLLDPYLRKHYADYAKYRTHKITSIVVDGRLPDKKVLQMAFEDMEIQDLADFCILRQIFIDPYKAKSLEECKTAVRTEYEARGIQKKADDKSGISKEKKTVDELLAMNELPPQTENPNININEQKIGAALKKADVRTTVAEPIAAAVPVDDTEDQPLPPTVDEEEDLLG